MNHGNQIIETIKAVRTSRGMTQEEMASILGVTRATYINIESGKRELTVSELEKIRESLSLSVGELLDPTIITEGDRAGKFEQIYMYILNKYFRDEGVPKTKLAKILYLIDFANFYERLEPMSEAHYVRRQYGPVADSFFWLTDELYERGEIDIQPLDFAQMIKPTPGEADLSRLTDEDKKIIDRVCDYWQGRRTSEIVNFTHSQKPWKSCRDGEIIPYSLIVQEDPDHVFAPAAP